jgi:hypothetical protein
MTGFRRVGLLFAALVGCAADVCAQSGIVEGVARAAEGDSPIPFALVKLVAADGSQSRTPAQGITNAEGQYRFSGIVAGRYRVQLLRIGFRPVMSDVVDVADGTTVQLPLRIAAQPLTLPTVNVASGACVTLTELPQHPQLETLWQQARGGASIREGLMARFRYRINLGEVSYELTADGRNPRGRLDRQMLNDPRWALRNLALNRARLLERGYYGPNDGWAMPVELNVLHEEFLKSHCLVTVAERGEGEVGLRFQPIRARRNFLDAGGTIWLDSATYLARRIEFEYVDGEDARGTVRLDFADIDVSGAKLRMPVGAEFALRPSRKNPARRTAGTITITYSNFEEVR